MAEDVLSQSEIDALLSALSAGEMDAEELKKEESEKKVKVYDFKRALRFSKDQIRSLSRIHENFARLLTTYFSAQLRTYVQISVASVDQLPYEEFVRSIPKLTILNVFRADPLEGRVLMEVNPNIAYAMLDRMLGGQGESVNKVDNLTEIESNIMKQMFERSLYAFSEAWESVIELDCYLEEFEVNSQFMQMVSPNETVVVISLNTVIGEVSGMINICLPHVVIEPIIPKLSGHYWMQETKKERAPEEVLSLKTNIKKASVPFVALLGETLISVEDFLFLESGDSIQLNTKTNEPLLIHVSGEPKFIAQPGKVNKKMAVQILEHLEGEGFDDE